ncbi:uncharacterized protein LOC108221502 [Daucus carota subsp. sativus]|uniref:uncharacterized protein LOC108221502 n=1 Tax=Daucus carota subsp. sativus TaxID=79200 RepID=UPI003082884D
MKSLFSFYKREGDSTEAPTPNNPATVTPDSPNSLPRDEMEIIVEAPKNPTVQTDPGLRDLICTFPVNQQDRIRKEYLQLGPCQPKLQNYPTTFDGRDNRRFQHRWFSLFPWLEYSVAKDKAFCFPCFLFEKNPPKFPLFTTTGCCNWSRMLAGKKGICEQHVGQTNSLHKRNVQSWADLLKTSQHIDRVIEKLPPEIVRQNRLRLKTTIAAVKYLGKEGLPFGGHDESSSSSSRGHFIEMIKSYASLENEIAKVVLENAPKHAMYIAPSIQKEILDIIATKIRSKIRQEIGDSKFCILVDESLDVSHKEQMAIILRFVDQEGYVRERYFEIVSVKDTTSITLKEHICSVLSTNKLQVQNIRGQGYDGASNMRGQFHGLKTLFLQDNPYAYYVHCFAHRLQLALKACARDVPDMHIFFQMLSSIVNFVGSSSKRTNLLKRDIQEAEHLESLADGNLETGKGLNQIRSLKRAGMTRWGSHFASVNTLVHIFDEVTQLLERGDAKGFLKALRTFDFIFCLLLTNKIMGITDLLSQALQRQSQDIVNAMNLTSSTKALLQELRDHGWDEFLLNVYKFGENHDLEMPKMDASYSMGTGRGCQQHDFVTNEHHYHFSMFNVIIDVQMTELNDRFTEQRIELLVLSAALDPKDHFKRFDIDKICELAEKFYPGDFDASEVRALRLQLEHYRCQVVSHKDFQDLSSLAQLCRQFVETGLAKLFPLVDILIRLVLTLPVSTATTERAFSAMKIIKTRLRNKMEDGYLSGCMMLHIEKEYVDAVDSEDVIDHFESIGDRRAQFR